MKRSSLYISILLVAIMGMTGCRNDEYFPLSPEEDHYSEPVKTVDTTGMNIPAEAITVARAIEIGDSIGAGATTRTKYYIKGFIKKFGSKHADGMANYGNAIFYMTDGKTSGRDFEAYQVYGINGERFTSTEQLQVGDYVVVYSTITNYNSTIETPGKGEGYVYASNNPLAYEDFSPEIEIDTTGALSCQEAVDIASGHAVVIGYASTVSAKSGGQQTVWMSDAMDGAKVFEAYYCNVKGEVEVGDFIAVEGDLLVYNDIVEIKNGNMKVLRKAPQAYTYFDETFEEDMGGFTITDMDDYAEDVWVSDISFGYMKAQASDFEAESWLISPAFSLEDATNPTLTFLQCNTTAEDPSEEFKLMISTNGEDWTELEITTYNEQARIKFELSDEIDLTDFAGEETVQLAFVYTSTSTSHARWCVKNIHVGEFK